MAFKNDEQLGRTCRAVLGLARLELLWTESGPSNACASIWAGKSPCPYSHGETLLFDVAWALWNGGDKLERGSKRKLRGGHPDFAELVHVLDPHKLIALGQLFIAIATSTSANGYGPIENWLLTYEGEMAARERAIAAAAVETPESVTEKANHARAVGDAFEKVFGEGEPAVEK